MGALDSIRQGLAGIIQWALGGGDEYDTGYTEHASRLAEYIDYYNGHQPRVLKPGKEGKDFNVIVNWCSLIIDRSVHSLFGGGVEFELPENSQTERITEIWDANKKDILLSDFGLYGAQGGTGYLKIVPDGIAVGMPRLVALNPLHVLIGTNPHDIERVEHYVVRYNAGETAYREVTRREYTEDIGELNPADTLWKIIMQKNGRETNGKWVTINETDWPFLFPPIAHTKNLPRAGDCYGRSDIEDILGLQTEYNTAVSNINKILWYAGHPRLWSKGKLGALQDWGAEKILQVSDPDGSINVVETGGDLASFMLFKDDLRSALMNISQTTDSETIKDKAGALTNFGLRVLFKDELAKLETKRTLYGECLEDINQRLLALEGVETDGGKVHFTDTLPVDDVEQQTALKGDLEMGIVSKSTVAQERGYDWEGEGGEQEKINAEKSDEGNVGGRILSDFLRGRNGANPV